MRRFLIKTNDSRVNRPFFDRNKCSVFKLIAETAHSEAKHTFKVGLIGIC